MLMMKDGEKMWNMKIYAKENYSSLNIRYSCNTIRQTNERVNQKLDPESLKIGRGSNVGKNVWTTTTLQTRQQSQSQRFQLQFLESSVGGTRVQLVCVDNRNLYSADRPFYLLLIHKNIVPEKIFAYMTEIWKLLSLLRGVIYRTLNGIAWLKRH